MFPIPEAAIEIPDCDRKQIGCAQQEVLHCGAPEIRIKVQRPSVVVALQVIHLRPGSAPAEFERVPPDGPAEIGKDFETILGPHSRKLYSRTDLSQFLSVDFGHRREAQRSQQIIKLMGRQ